MFLRASWSAIRGFAMRTTSGVDTFSIVLALEAAATLPLSYYLPTEHWAPIAAIAILSVLGVCAARTAGPEYRATQFASLFVGAIGFLVVTMNLGRKVRELCFLSIVLLCGFVISLIWKKPGHRRGRVALLAQQFATVATVHSWLIIEPLRQRALSGANALPDHLQMGARFLFMGPLALIPFAVHADKHKWRGLAAGYVVACILQYSSGLIEVGSSTRSVYLPYIGIGLGLSSILLFAWRSIATFLERDSKTSDVAR